jgi:hypothetical protein
MSTGLAILAYPWRNDADGGRTASKWRNHHVSRSGRPTKRHIPCSNESFLKYRNCFPSDGECVGALRILKRRTNVSVTKVCRIDLVYLSNIRWNQTNPTTVWAKQSAD